MAITKGRGKGKSMRKLYKHKKSAKKAAGKRRTKRRRSSSKKCDKPKKVGYVMSRTGCMSVYRKKYKNGRKTYYVYKTKKVGGKQRRFRVGVEKKRIKFFKKK